MLVNLTYLNLNACRLKTILLGILPKLSHLQYLSVSCDSNLAIVKGEEIASLKKLETFGGHFYDILAANPRVARDNYFYGGFINFFLQFKLI